MSSYTEGQIHQLANALEARGFTPDDITKLGQSEDLPAIRGVLRGTYEIKPGARFLREEDGVIYFSVTSDGTTGEDWIARLESKGFRVGDYAKQVLRTPSFKPTSGVSTEVAVLKGMLFEDQSRITKKIRAEADKRKLLKPSAELACLIRLKFRDLEIEAMGLWWIVAMHEPINDSGGDLILLYASRRGGGPWLGAYYERPLDGWGRDYGFAFAVSQVSSQH
ncbi:MAG: hypothetical protein HYT29_01505 [Parcubacteria group bacterium]|nr:hypothetical protein [Parcubacteria group bacterium]